VAGGISSAAGEAIGFAPELAFGALSSSQYLRRVTLAGVVGAGSTGVGQIVGSAIGGAVRSWRGRIARTRGLDFESRVNSRLSATEQVLNTLDSAGHGFDSASVVGTGRNARLIINEIKSNKGYVGIEDFSAFGFNESGSFSAGRLLRNLKLLRQAITSEVTDPVTQAALLKQLGERAFAVRIIGGPATRVSHAVLTRLGVAIKLGGIDGASKAFLNPSIWTRSSVPSPTMTVPIEFIRMR
jgi:hypothetical protein